MNEPNFWAIRFIHPPVPGLIIWSPALSPEPSYYVDANGFINFKTGSMSMGKFSSVLLRSVLHNFVKIIRKHCDGVLLKKSQFATELRKGFFP